MARYVVHRIVTFVLTSVVVSTMIFLLVRVLPGDPVQVMLGDYATPELERALRHEFGLDQPLYKQYAAFMSQLARGDLGISMRSRQPVWSEIAKNAEFSIQLAVAAILISIVVGVTLGLIAGAKRHTPVDGAVMAFSMIGYSMPAFWLGILLLLAFAIHLGWFPVLGAGEKEGILGQLRHLILPALAVGLRQAGLLARMTRSTLVEVLAEDYIRTARAKGLSNEAVLIRHALKNAAIPIVTIIGLSMGHLLGGAVVTEIVFTRPGLGRLLIDAVFTRDYAMLQGLVVVWAIAFMTVNLVVDLTYSYLDPRIRYT